MFSYRHAFHAGNHADVLKHVVLVQLLTHFVAKEAPFWVIDTHAGAGRYALDSEWSAKRREFDEGIARLWPRTDAPAAVAEYLGAIRHENPDGRLRHYPGSPWIALQYLRDRDRLRLFEMHVNESKALAENIASAGREAARQTLVAATDGFAGLKALLPPPPRRAIILIDPSYEDKADYARVLQSVKDALTRFATGCYAIWYPQVQRREPSDLVRKLLRLPDVRWLHIALTVRKPAPDGLGLNGSGLVVINPPWTLQATMANCLPWLAETLGEDDSAHWALDASVAEPAGQPAARSHEKAFTGSASPTTRRVRPR